MKFPKRIIVDEILFLDAGETGDVGLPLPVTKVDDEIYDVSPKHVEFHSLTFKYGDNYYNTSYQCGEDQQPFEFESDKDIDCDQVYPHVVTTTVFKTYPQN